MELNPFSFYRAPSQIPHLRNLMFNSASKTALSNLGKDSFVLRAPDSLDSLSIVRFGNKGREGSLELNDPDTNRYGDIIDGTRGGRSLIDSIIRDDFDISEDGSHLSFPMPVIDLPDFQYGNQGGGAGGGTGQGLGQGFGNGLGLGMGTGVGQGQSPGQGGSGGTGAGPGAGQHGRNPFSYPVGEIAKILSLECGLPNLQPRGDGDVTTKRDVFDALKRNPPGLLEKRRTLRAALKRNIAKTITAGKVFDPKRDVQFRPTDRRFVTDRVVTDPFYKVAIVNMADYSGSMGPEQMKKVKKANFLLGMFLRYQYGKLAADLTGVPYSDDKFYGQGLVERYVLHDSQAKTVGEREFYEHLSGGGTLISAGYEHVKQMIQSEYNPADWNVYVFHYTDGDTYSDDNPKSKAVIRELLDMGVNIIGYSEVDGYSGPPYHKGGFGEYLVREGKDMKDLRLAGIKDNSLEEYIKLLNHLLGPTKKNPV